VPKQKSESALRLDQLIYVEKEARKGAETLKSLPPSHVEKVVESHVGSCAFSLAQL